LDVDFHYVTSVVTDLDLEVTGLAHQVGGCRDHDAERSGTAAPVVHDERTVVTFRGDDSLEVNTVDWVYEMFITANGFGYGYPSAVDTNMRLIVVRNIRMWPRDTMP